MSKKSKNKIQKSNIHAASSERGFTLLLAAIVSSVVLSIGAAVFSIALKQVTLSSVGRDSQFAFYAADTGSECALYWDVRFAAFPTSTQSVGTRSSIDCGGSTISVVADRWSDRALSTFQYDASGRCAIVTVDKRQNSIGIATVVHADGHSVPCGSIAGNAQALQRSVELHY